MPKAKLIARWPDREPVEVAVDGPVTIGRSLENVLAFDHPTLSERHAVIDAVDGVFVLSDCGSELGSWVNGERVVERRELSSGDVIVLGVGSLLVVIPEPVASAEPVPVAASEEPSAPAVPSAGSSRLAVVMGAVAGLAITAAVGLSLAGSPAAGSVGPEAVTILSPAPGAVLHAPEPVRIRVDEESAIERVIYALDGEVFAVERIPPYDTVIDPERLASKVSVLTPGRHTLSVAVEGPDGRRVPQRQLLEVVIPPSPGEVSTRDPLAAGGGGAPTAGPDVAVDDVARLAQAFASQLSQKSGYVVQPELAERIRQQTSAFRRPFADELRPERRHIVKAFQDRGVYPLVGLVLAVSQSGLSPSTDGEIGYWRVPIDVARSEGFLAPDEPDEAIDDPVRAAEVSAAYTRALVNVFGIDDFPYAIACFGMPLSRAGEMKARLEMVAPDPASRRDFWKLVEAGVVPQEGAERVARFFAAGIVGENPQRFGTEADSLSSLLV